MIVVRNRVTFLRFVAEVNCTEISPHGSPSGEARSVDQHVTAYMGRNRTETSAVNPCFPNSIE